MDKKHEILSKYFGYASFRKGQEALIDAQLSGRDVFGIMPTGGGKSLCYQIPALLTEGITLVVSPLISLMKDQVMALKSSGVAAAYINTSLTPEQISLVYRNMIQGMYKLIYVAPERLMTDGFLNAVSRLKIAMVVADEAHCISQWGQDFRPGYLRIREFLEALPYRPVVSAFTATATPAVQRDVSLLLGLRDPYVLVTGFDRPNLRFEVINPHSKSDALLRLLKARKDKCGIVYCATRKDVEKICDFLRSNNLSATRYHAGLEDEERQNNQDDFVYDRCHIMVATNAFGMGINKSNVSFVIHYNMPQSIEAYYQEAGRAGRDGAPADCILLYAPRDIGTAKFLILHPGENDMLTREEQAFVEKQDLLRLDAMVSYCKTQKCLRGNILEYFGENHQENCKNCSNCTTETEEKDITVPARMILSCTQHIYRNLGFYLGASLVIQTLRGSSSKPVKARGLHKLPTYGLMTSSPRQEIQAMLDSLESQGYLQTDPKHGAIFPTEKARGILFEQAPVTMLVPKASKVSEDKSPTAETSAPTPATAPDASELLTILKELRLRLATKAKVPAYIIFSNATLLDMVAKAPRTPEEFLAVNGVGKYKAEQYGEAFLSEINKYFSHESTD